jgi:hypothetical protein
MMAPADKVVSNITLNFCLLKKAPLQGKSGRQGRVQINHGQTCGVQTWVVGCAFENLLGMEYEQQTIQKCLDIM